MSNTYDISDAYDTDSPYTPGPHPTPIPAPSPPPYDAPVPYDNPYPYDPPAPDTIPVSPQRELVYLFTDLTGQLIAQVPLIDVTWSRSLNSAGKFKGTIPVEDPHLAGVDWITATVPNKTCVWVQTDGPALLYGGLVQQRTYTMKDQTVTVEGSEFWQYANHRVQAQDYTTYTSEPGGHQWAIPPGYGAVEMAEQIIADVLAVPGSIPLLTVTQVGATPDEFWIVGSFPISQQQQLGSLVQQLQELGYDVGFDFTTQVQFVNGEPTASIQLAYPHAGVPYAQGGLAVDVSGAIDFTYPEDGTSQADKVWEMATSTGGIGSVNEWEPAIEPDGWPLLEVVESHMVFSALTYNTDEEVSPSKAVLTAWADSDLALYAYPAVAPTVTLPLFGWLVLGSSPPAFGGLSIDDVGIGDDMLVQIPGAAGAQAPIIPRFPGGMSWVWRVVQIDVAVANAGTSTMTLTFNQPPYSTPVEPPQ